MRILCFINSLSSGGAERQLVGLATMLTRDGHQVEVCTYKTDNFYANDLKCNNIGYSSLNTNNICKRLFGTIKKIRSIKPDCVIAYLEQPSTLCCVAKLFCNFKLIASERNTTQTLTRNARLRFWLYQYADWIVPNSFSQAAFLKEHYPQYSNKVKTITNYTDLETFVPASTLSNNAIPRIVVAARVTPQKNIPVFAKALSLLKERNIQFKVDWYGNHLNNDYYELCQNSIIENKVRDVFVLHPSTPDIISEYQKSDAFCLPSKYEGYPNVVCEAMSCGLPILCSNVCDNPMIVTNGVTGLLFNPNDPEEIANQLYKFLSMSVGERQRMGKKGRLLAEQLFSKEKFMKQYYEIIN